MSSCIALISHLYSNFKLEFSQWGSHKLKCLSLWNDKYFRTLMAFVWYTVSIITPWHSAYFCSNDLFLISYCWVTWLINDHSLLYPSDWSPCLSQVGSSLYISDLNPMDSKKRMESWKRNRRQLVRTSIIFKSKPYFIYFYYIKNIDIQSRSVYCQT